MIIDLPWPSRDLHPNARVHWARKAKAAKRARADAAWIARAAGLRHLNEAVELVTVTTTFAPPDNRRRDLDGMLSAIKPYLDGIADVIGIDDSTWSIAIRRDAPRRGGSVRVEISA